MLTLPISHVCLSLVNKLVLYTDTRQIFGPTIEYIAIHSVLTENVIVGGPPGSHVHPQAEPKWYQNDRMNLLFQNRDVPMNITWKHLICIKQDGRHTNYDFTFFVISQLLDGIFR